MKILTSLFLALTLMSCQSTGDSASAAEPAGGAELMNTHCIFMQDEEVDPTVTVDFDGNKIGFCCDSCANKFVKMDDDKKREKIGAAMKK